MSTAVVGWLLACVAAFVGVPALIFSALDYLIWKDGHR